MKNHLNKELVPTSEAEDFNRMSTKWVNGVYACIDEGAYATLYIGHESFAYIGEDGAEIIETRAVPLRMPKPVTRAMAINSAEMLAYGLNTAMDVASFNASLARKSRIDPMDTEVAAHDAFIGWVKDELTKIGIV